MILLTFLLACFGTASGPCDEYCNYMCTCHGGDADFDCDQCRIEYASADPALQDQCEVALNDQIATDESENLECSNSSGSDTAAAGR